GQPDRFRKDRSRSSICDAMQRLAPPVVGGNLQVWNRARLIHQLRRLLLQRHPLNQVIHPRLDGLGRIEVKRSSALSDRTANHKKEKECDAQCATKASFHGNLLRNQSGCETTRFSEMKSVNDYGPTVACSTGNLRGQDWGAGRMF